MAPSRPCTIAWVRHFILGTAGHIDHGKTALVRALTGIDCDRLPEEKSRGITIDLGFAWLDNGDVRIGIVDVPGHERFIRNMLAGATGIDLALLVVAADDAVMPQTREHLEILSLLGLSRGVIALTKCDLADEATRAVVVDEVRELVRGTFLEDAPIVATSATSGEGIDALRATLFEACRAAADESATGPTWFRLAIDRSFVVQGHGTVVTGSVTSGSVRVGDELEWLPARRRVRVRALHNHDLAVDEVHRGMRAAINLAGVSHDEVERGQELATPGFLVPSRTLTVKLRASGELRRPLRHRTPIRLHIGTAEILGTLALLDADTVAPGQWALAQVFLDAPAMAVWGQPFVIRESAGQRTLGGGQVLQPAARKIRRRHIEVIEHVERMTAPSPIHRAETVVWFHGPTGFAPTDLAREAGLAPDAVPPIVAELAGAGRIVEVPLGPGRSQRLHADVVADLEQRLLQTIAHRHELQPLVTLHDRRGIESDFEYVGDPVLVHAIVDRLLARGELVGDDRRVALSRFQPKLSANQRRLLERIVAEHQRARFQPPDIASFANLAGGNAAGLKDLVEVAIADGSLVRISPQWCLHSDSEAELRRIISEALAQTPAGLTVADIRDRLGTTRKYAVPICEYLDSVGLTRREGDLRFRADSEIKYPGSTSERLM